jgi:hypothetical protein
MRFATRQNHEMTQPDWSKATKLPDPALPRRKSKSFLALPKAATKQVRIAAVAIVPPAATPVL